MHRRLRAPAAWTPPWSGAGSATATTSRPWPLCGGPASWWTRWRSSAPWAALPALFDEVLVALGAIDGTLVASAHQSHAYSDGACLYFTFAGRGPEGDDDWRERFYRQAWDTVIQAALGHGAAISHHHGIGLNRSRFLPRALGSGFDVLARLKESLDPVGILNPAKLGLPSPFGPAPWP